MPSSYEKNVQKKEKQNQDFITFSSSWIICEEYEAPKKALQNTYKCSPSAHSNKHKLAAVCADSSYFISAFESFLKAQKGFAD